MTRSEQHIKNIGDGSFVTRFSVSYRLRARNFAYDAEAFPALSRAVAWIFSGGSIDAERFVPLFTIGGDSDLADLEALLDDLGVGSAISRDTEAGRAAEYRPARDARFSGGYSRCSVRPSERKTPPHR